MPDKETVIKALQYLISGECTDTQFDYLDEIEAAIALLKEQEPVEPEKRELPYGMYNAVQYEYKCGACGCGLRKNGKWRANYCPECGRAAKWE